jgi:hypothetical protein
MRIPLAALGVGTVLCLAAAPLNAASASSVHEATVTALSLSSEADYEMDEPDGATVMTDSSGNGIDGVINQDGLDTGYVIDGATGYNWPRRPPEQPPASPERVIQVPDSPHLDPGGDTFTVEIRYRTKEKFGNIIQKGQSATKGGQWKIQNPQGLPSCLFKGSLGRAATRAKTALNDNTWHTLTCVRTPSSVTLYVDGVFENRKNGATGTIDNVIPMTIGGKINCDQIEITCDYFSGQIDYVRITRGG